MKSMEQTNEKIQSKEKFGSAIKLEWINRWIEYAKGSNNGILIRFPLSVWLFAIIYEAATKFLKIQFYSKHWFGSGTENALKNTEKCLVFSTKARTANRRSNSEHTGICEAKNKKMRLRSLTKHMGWVLCGQPRKYIIFCSATTRKKQPQGKSTNFNEMFFYWDGLWWSQPVLCLCLCLCACVSVWVCECVSVSMLEWMRYWQTKRFVLEKSANKNECPKHSLACFIFSIVKPMLFYII